jgi:cytochrome c
MSSSNLNMYAGAFLGTVFVMMTVGIVGEAIFHSETPEQEGFAIAVAEGEAPAEGGGAEAPAIEPIAPLLASADAAAGATVFKKCAACHTVENGGANKVGPNLWEIVNRPVAGHEGFNYSAAMKTFAEGGTAWDYDHLNAFLKKPKDLVPGTAMGFAGLSKVEDRANVVAYLRSLSDSPAALPDANAAPAAGGEAAAPAEAPAATDAGATEAPAATEGTAPAN